MRRIGKACEKVQIGYGEIKREMSSAQESWIVGHLVTPSGLVDTGSLRKAELAHTFIT